MAQYTLKNLEIGNMVLLKDDNAPPLHRPLGRITQIHPGNDGVVRVVTVRTQSGTYKRCTKRVVLLTIE